MTEDPKDKAAEVIEKIIDGFRNQWSRLWIPGAALIILIVATRSCVTIQPGQVVVYMWEGYQFKEWKIFDRALIGQPKALHFAGGYTQFRYYFMNGSPGVTTDRGVRVDYEKAS